MIYRFPLERQIELKLCYNVCLYKKKTLSNVCISETTSTNQHIFVERLSSGKCLQTEFELNSKEKPFNLRKIDFPETRLLKKKKEKHQDQCRTDRSVINYRLINPRSRKGWGP